MIPQMDINPVKASASKPDLTERKECWSYGGEYPYDKACLAQNATCNKRAISPNFVEEGQPTRLPTDSGLGEEEVVSNWTSLMKRLMYLRRTKYISIM